MEPAHQIVLREMRVFLVENMRAQDVMDHLIQDDCLNLDEQEDIQSIANGKDRDKVRKLLDILGINNIKAFNTFVKALRCTGSDYVAQELCNKLDDVKRRGQDPSLFDIDPTEIHSPSVKIPVPCSVDEIDAVPVDPTSDTSWFYTLPTSTQQLIPTDRHLTLLALEIPGPDVIGLLLDLSPGHLQQCKANAPLDVTLQTVAVLQTWKQQSASAASMAVLVEMLSRGRLLNPRIRQVLCEICESGKITDIWVGDRRRGSDYGNGC